MLGLGCTVAGDRRDAEGPEILGDGHPRASGRSIFGV